MAVPRRDRSSLSGSAASDRSQRTAGFPPNTFGRLGPAPSDRSQALGCRRCRSRRNCLERRSARSRAALCALRMPLPSWLSCQKTGSDSLRRESSSSLPSAQIGYCIPPVSCMDGSWYQSSVRNQTILVSLVINRNRPDGLNLRRRLEPSCSADAIGTSFSSDPSVADHTRNLSVSTSTMIEPSGEKATSCATSDNAWIRSPVFALQSAVLYLSPNGFGMPSRLTTREASGLQTTWQSPPWSDAKNGPIARPEEESQRRNRPSASVQTIRS